MALLDDATRQYVRLHARDDVRELALRNVPAGVDMKAALTQIEGRQLAARKLPAWAAADGLCFPPRLALEQCSSLPAAAYKRDLVRRLLEQEASAGKPLGHFADLTGGLGVDFAAIAPLFPRATYVDVQEQLCRLAAHNLPLLGCPHARVLCGEAADLLRSDSYDADPPAASLILLDPARRDAAGRKVARIADCSPDVAALQELLRSRARFILIKLSPMLDITAALRDLQGICEVHVVALEGECKELLLVMSNQPTDSELLITCVDLPGGQPFSFRRTDEQRAPLVLASRLESFLYEPHAALLKGGAFRLLCQHFPVQKLAPQTHLYTSATPVPDFPGRAWRVRGATSFGRKDLRAFLADVPAADLAVRGFPTDVATLRRQLHLPQGGTASLMATTLADGSRRLLRLERL